MRKILLGIAAALGLTGAAQASLPVGAKAPAFSTSGALAGKPFRFDLGTALKRGPVVLYFYPKAFTKGCTLEARAFSESMDEFRKAGAQVIGLSADDLPTLKRFRSGCRNASRRDRHAADPRLSVARPVVTSHAMSNRTTLRHRPPVRIVIALRNGWSGHVGKALDASCAQALSPLSHGTQQPPLASRACRATRSAGGRSRTLFVLAPGHRVLGLSSSSAPGLSRARA